MRARDATARRAGGSREAGWTERLRGVIEEAYEKQPTGCGASFGEILCHELHTQGLTFIQLAEKWGISLPTLGSLLWDHCCRLEAEPLVNHDYQAS